MSRAIARAILVALLFAIPSLACAKWVRYENDNFIAYSQGKSRKVHALMRELELFRAAALQIFSVRAPDGAPKTLVVIAKDRKEFRALGGSDWIAGWARREGAITLIVISAAGVASDNMRTARHEYAHALLSYDETDYPSWYDEGFAELAALVEIDEASSSFVLGQGTKRRLGSRVLEVPWNELIDDDFNTHSLGSGFSASNAYGQAWLLMHYLAIGPDRENAQRLGLYLASIREGTSSVDAFQEAFGRMPQDIWDEEMHDYTDRLPFYRLRFKGVSLDEEFESGPVPQGEIENLLLHLQASQRGRKAKRLEDVPRADYIGYWSLPRYSSYCETLVEIQYDAASDRFSIRWEKEERADPPRDFVEYRVKADKGVSLRLKQDSETGEDHNVVPEFDLSQREGGWMCMTHPSDKDYGCDRAYLRCEAPTRQDRVDANGTLGYIASMTLRDKVEARLPNWERWYPSLFDAASDLGIIKAEVCDPNSLLLTRRHQKVRQRAEDAHREQWGGKEQD